MNDLMYSKCKFKLPIPLCVQVVLLVLLPEKTLCTSCLFILGC